MNLSFTITAAENQGYYVQASHVDAGSYRGVLFAGGLSESLNFVSEQFRSPTSTKDIDPAARIS